MRQTVLGVTGVFEPLAGIISDEVKATQAGLPPVIGMRSPESLRRGLLSRIARVRPRQGRAEDHPRMRSQR